MTARDWGQFAPAITDIEARLAAAPHGTAIADQAQASAREFLAHNQVDPADHAQLWAGLAITALYLQGLDRAYRAGAICPASKAAIDGVYLGLLGTLAPWMPPEARQ